MFPRPVAVLEISGWWHWQSDVSTLRAETTLALASPDSLDTFRADHNESPRPHPARPDGEKD